MRQVWEQELYNEMQYVAPNSSFHTFEADASMAGVYFADEREGAHFLSAVMYV